MLIADIKGKLDLKELYSEDFLTSSVFSSLNYMNPKYLEEFLNQSVNINGDKLNIKIDFPIYEFWPWLSNEKKFGGGAEPDVVIYSDDLAIIVESKNYAGKSGEGMFIDENFEEIISDQLGREYFAGLTNILGNYYGMHNNKKIQIDSFIIIFLTRHSFFPTEEITKSLESIRKIDEREFNKATNNIYWLNWNKIIPILEDIIVINNEIESHYKISNDLLNFLDRRDIGLFRGFDFLNENLILELEFNQDNIFYKTKKSKYWEEIDRESFDFEKKYLFYKKLNSKYWEEIDKESFDIEKKYLFYKKLNSKYWVSIMNNLNLNIDKIIFYQGG